MKLVIIGAVIGFALATAMILTGVWTQRVRDSDTKIAVLQTAIENEVSDIKAKLEAKLEKMDTKLDILVRIATSPVNADLGRRP